MPSSILWRAVLGDRSQGGDPTGYVLWFYTQRSEPTPPQGMKSLTADGRRWGPGAASPSACAWVAAGDRRIRAASGTSGCPNEGTQLGA